MLSDFLTLELYFGSENAALSIEDLSKTYKKSQIQNAIEQGDLCCTAIPCASGRENILTWLSDQGRKKANLSFS